jgi:hypothetical protein
MAGKDEDDAPSLELPSFGFGRKRRNKRAESSGSEVPTDPDHGPEVPPASEPEITPATEPEVPATPGRGPEVAPATEPEVPAEPSPEHAPGQEPSPRPEIEPVTPGRPSQPEPAPEIDPQVPSRPTGPEPAPEIDPVIPTGPEFQPSTPLPPEPTPHPVPTEPDVEPTTPGPPPERRPEPAPEPGSEQGEAASDRVGTLVDDRDHESAPARREPRFPVLPALPAVLLVGAVVGAAAVLMTWGSLRLCEAATGTASCGGGPGLLMLLAILIALTYLGGWLLRGFGIGDAGSTSLLAVGLLAVVAMLFLVDSLDEWAGALWVVIVTIAAYAVSWRVTAALVDAGTDQQ